jgi:hypothetical protein
MPFLRHAVASKLLPGARQRSGPHDNTADSVGVAVSRRRALEHVQWPSERRAASPKLVDGAVP